MLQLALRSEPVLHEVASEVQDSGLEVFVRVDREQAARLGVSMQTVNDTLNSAFGMLLVVGRRRVARPPARTATGQFANSTSLLRAVIE